VFGWESLGFSSRGAGQPRAALQLGSFLQRVSSHPRRGGATLCPGQAGDGWEQGGDSESVQSATDESH